MANPTRSPNGISTAVKNSALWSYISQDPTKQYQFFDEFDNILTAANSVMYTITKVGAGTTAVTAGNGGLLLITNAAADNDASQLQVAAATVTMAFGKKAWFKCRFATSDATQSDILVGLAALDTTVQGAADGTGVTDGIFFNKDDGDALIDAQVQLNTTTGQTRAVGIGTLVDNTFITLGWYFDGVSETQLYINDVKVSTIATTTANLPDANLTPSISIVNGEAVAKTMTIDYIFVAQER